MRATAIFAAFAAGSLAAEFITPDSVEADIQTEE